MNHVKAVLVVSPPKIIQNGQGQNGGLLQNEFGKFSVTGVEHVIQRGNQISLCKVINTHLVQ